MLLCRLILAAGKLSLRAGHSDPNQQQIPIGFGTFENIVEALRRWWRALVGVSPGREKSVVIRWRAAIQLEPGQLPDLQRPGYHLFELRHKAGGAKIEFKQP